jgi:hypothetical protein
VIHEYRCEKCKGTFVGDGEDFEEHYSDPTGGTFGCGGIGQLIGTWQPVTVEGDDEQGA